MAAWNIKPTTFKAHLTWLIVGALFALALLSGGVSSTLIAGRIQAWAKDYLRDATTQIAQANAFAFLSADHDVATGALRAATAAPGVNSAAFLTQRYKPIVQRGTLPHFSLIAPSPNQWPPGDSTSTVILSPEGTWHFLAPVWPVADKAPFDEGKPAPDLLGFVYIGCDSTFLNEATGFTIALAVGIASLFALVLAYWVNVLAGRLTQPLSTLSETMRGVEDTKDLTHAPLLGPREFEDIAHAYNSLMDTVQEQMSTIDAHTQLLESTVQARTRALQKALERAEQTVSTKSDHMETTAHEMRTLLHSITGNIQLAREELAFLEGAGTVNEYLENLRQSKNLLVERLTKLLDFSRLEAGATMLAPNPAHLPTLIERVKRYMQHSATEGGNTLSVDYTTTTDAPAFLDEEKVQDIVTNLLSNACSFTENGEIHLNVHQTTDRLELVVRDTGCGIPAEQLPSIFEPYCQAGVANHNRRHRGTGYGLAITKRWCDMMNASISVESKLGAGSVFSVSIPIADENTTA